ncbi:MAG: MaoC/PaaZ C-terminal domain-containing protein [Solirubrobacterales bacterium]
MRRRFAEVAVGEELPTLARTVTREDVKAYADASGDQNPLHQDDGSARAVGFPGIIAHGMFTMAHLTSCLVAWLGDASALRRLRVQFRAPVFMGETIVAGGTVRALDPQTRTATLNLWVTLERDGSTEYPIRRGEAEVRLG